MSDDADRTGGPNADDHPNADDDAMDRDDAGAAAESGDGGFSLSLPPVSLPPLFPEDFRVLWPVGDGPRTRMSPRVAALALVAFDLLDAALALTTDAVAATAARTVGGALVAGSAFGLLGVPYVLEVAAALLGYAHLTAFPTLTALLVVRRLR